MVVACLHQVRTFDVVLQPSKGTPIRRPGLPADMAHFDKADRRVLVAALVTLSLLLLFLSSALVSANGSHIPARVVQATGGYLVRANPEAPVIILGPPLQFEAFPSLTMVVDAAHDGVLLDLRFTDPDDGDEVRITFVQPISFVLQGSVADNTVALNMGPDPTIFQGGVAFDMSHHGTTGVGIADFPEVRTSMAFWGFVDVFVNDVKVATTVGHMMVLMDGIRDDTTDELRVPPTPDEGLEGMGGEIHFIILPQPLMDSLGLTPPDPLMPNEALMEPFIHVNWDRDSEIRVLSSPLAAAPAVDLLVFVVVVAAVGVVAAIAAFLVGRSLGRKG